MWTFPPSRTPAHLHRHLRLWPHSSHQAVDVAASAQASSEPRGVLPRLACLLGWRRTSVQQTYRSVLAVLPTRLVPSETDISLACEALEAIDQLLDGLPRRARQVFLLNRIEGLGQQAIADQLGISMNAVERDLRRAFMHCLTRPAQVS